MKYLLIILTLTLSVFHLSDASARVFIGGGVVVGAPYYSYPPYYAYYPPYPYYPAPGYPLPPGYPPAYAYSPYPVPPPAPQDHYYTSDNGEYCREYRHTVIIQGARQQAFGHACREPDGQWQIVD